MNSDVDYLFKILELINKVKEVVKTLQYGNGDTRKTFFEMLVSSLQVYYLGFNSVFVVNRIDPLSFNLEKFETPHLKNFKELFEGLKLKDQGCVGIGTVSPNRNFITIYSDILKMNLINNCWVCFESTLREIDHELNIIHPRNNKPVPVYYIYSHKKFNTDTKFLSFLGECRNAMHNNSFHTKEFREYLLNGKSLKLEKDKKIEFMDGETILKIVEKLSNVALDMWKNLNYPDFIPDMYNSI